MHATKKYNVTEKGEAGASVDPVGSGRVYVVVEMKESGMVLWSLDLRRRGK
jgi:hypothetical protein